MTQMQLTDAIEGFYIAQTALFLQTEGVLDTLDIPQTAAALAEKHGFDADLLSLVLVFLALRSDLIVQMPDGRFAIRPAHCDAAPRTHRIEQYLGTYGPLAAHLPDILRDPGCAPQFIDRASHRRAFRDFDAAGLLAQCAAGLGARSVLDIGCGPGHLLRTLAAHDPAFRGIGLDISAEMVDEARIQTEAAGMSDRLTFRQADCRDIAVALAPDDRAGIDLIAASSLMNELCGTQDTVTEFLKSLGALFPGRRLLIADYFGQLGKAHGSGPALAYLHDFVQAISGQGVPPATLGAWLAIYQSSGCWVRGHFEGIGLEFRWYVDLVQLPGAHDLAHA